METAPTPSDSRVGTLEATGLGLCLLVLLADSVGLMLSGDGERPSSLHGLPLDDVWIHLSYARSLAEDGSFAYNPGVWENGITAPLWSFLLALPLKLGIEGALAAKGLSILSGIVLVALVWALARQLGGSRAALVAAVALVLEPWTSILAVSGMEALAASAAAVAAVLLALRARWWACGLALAAAGLLRPELGLLVPAALLAAPGWPERRKLFLPPSLAGASWMLYGLVVSGHPLPNAFRTKVHAGFEPLGQLASVGGLFSAAPRELGLLGWLLLLLALGLCGLGMLVAGRRQRSLALLVGAPVGVLVFYVAALPLGASADPLTYASIQSIYFARYLLVVLPWFVLWGALGWCLAYARAPSPAARAAVLVAGLAVLGGVAVTERAELAEAYVRNTEEIEALHGRMADWIRENVPADAVVGVSDAGRIRYGIPQQILDLTGLNSSEFIGMEDRVPALLDAGITHAAIWPAWHGGLQEDPRLRWTHIGGREVEQNTVAAYPLMLLYRVEPAQ